MLKRTVLYSLGNEKYDAQFIDFGGWEMPVRYTSVVDEHLAVRNAVGVFDVSHMGNFTVVGKDAYAAVNYLISNDLDKIESGQAIYTPLLYDSGTFVDDIVVYLHDRENCSMVVNASNVEKDFVWMNEVIAKKGFDAKLLDLSAEKSLIAIQGKEAFVLLKKLFHDHDPTKAFYFSILDYSSGGRTHSVMVANTGYTGEPGVEVWCDNAVAPEIFERSIELGAKPCGLGARDSLRLEKGYSLYGHEITDKTNALEAGLGWAVNLNKANFVGKDALMKIKEVGAERKLIGFVMEDRAIARSGCPVYGEEAAEGSRLIAEVSEQGHAPIGYVTSGGYSPHLKTNIGLAYVPKGYGGEHVNIAIRDRLIRAVRHKRIFC